MAKNPMEKKPMPKHIACINTHVVIQYVKKHHPEVSLDDLLNGITHSNDFLVEDVINNRLTPIDLDYLVHMDNWVSNQLWIKLWQNAKALTHDLYIPYKAGLESYDLQKLSWMNIAMRFVSVPRIIAKIPQKNAEFNRNKTVEIVEIHPDNATLRLHFDSDKPATKDTCMYNRGIYESLGRITGTPASVEERACTFEGDKYCEFYVTWIERPRHWRLLNKFKNWVAGDVIEDLWKKDLEKTEIILKREEEIKLRTKQLSNSLATQESLNKELAEAYKDLQILKDREQYLDQQLRIRDVLQTSEDVGAQILHENKNLLQPLGNLVSRTNRLISHTKGLLQTINANPELRNRIDNHEIENLEFLLETVETGNRGADQSYRLIISSYEDFRQVYNPREEAKSDLNRDLEAVTNLIIDRNYRSFITVTKEFNPIGVPKEYDSARFNRGVFWNIIKNAREAIVEENSKHTAGYEGKILVRTESRGDKVVIFIYDNGVGVPDGYEDKMFEKKETTKTSGTGLGLYTARLILEENNYGKIYYQKSDLSDFKTKMVVELDLQ